MNVITLELAQTALLALIVGVLLAAGRVRADVGGVGWRLIFLGFTLVWAAAAFQSISRISYGQVASSVTEVPMAAGMVMIGSMVGFALVGAEMVRTITTARATNRTRAMAAAVNKLKVQLSSGQDMLRGVLKGSLSGVIVVKAVRDDNSVIVDLSCELMNGAAAQILGCTSDQLLGRPMVREIPALESEGLFRECVSVIETGLPFNEERRYAFAGSAEWLHAVAVKLGDGCTVTFTNISARKQAEEQLRHAALHDVLTELPNRGMFIQRLEYALHWAHRLPQFKFAVLFFDFDRFKQVNDTLGHEAGDELLISIANRLRGELGFTSEAAEREIGHLPARLGGDEFVVLLNDVTDLKGVLAVVELFESVLGQPHEVAGQPLMSSASIGIVMCDGRYTTSDEIIRDADTAMYEAKRAGRSCHVVFDEQLHRQSPEVVRERAA